MKGVIEMSDEIEEIDLITDIPTNRGTIINVRKRKARHGYSVDIREYTLDNGSFTGNAVSIPFSQVDKLAKALIKATMS